jgi:hypothetical protein
MKIDGKNINHFNGWDFMELAGEWNLLDKYDDMPWVDKQWAGSQATRSSNPPNPRPTIHHNDDSRPIREFLEALCQEYMENHDESLLTKYANDIRMYTRKLALEDSSFYAPLWRGLARVEDDFTIVRTTILLLPCMWT